VSKNHFPKSGKHEHWPNISGRPWSENTFDHITSTRKERNQRGLPQNSATSTPGIRSQDCPLFLKRHLVRRKSCVACAIMLLIGSFPCFPKPHHGRVRSAGELKQFVSRMFPIGVQRLCLVRGWPLSRSSSNRCGKLSH
jgi:hypothetical protein